MWYLRWSRNGLPLVVVLFLFSSVLGCKRTIEVSQLEKRCSESGLCDEELPPPELFDVICDHSAGAASACTPDHLGVTIELVISRAATRPGTHLRLWMLAGNGAPIPITEQVSPRFKARGERARAAERERWTKQVKELLIAAATPSFSHPSPLPAHLAEAISQVMLADSHGLVRRLIIVSDLRELSLVGDFRCTEPLPSVPVWLRKLHRHELLTPASLEKTRVEVAYMDSAGRSCPHQVAWALGVRRLWSAAFRSAGASEVRFESGAPHVAEGDQVEPVALGGKR